jgi:hypothetical protein
MKISLEYEKRTYTLEFTRETIRQMESLGFVADELFTKPALRIPELFYGAFAAHHRGIKRKEVDRIYNGLANRSDLITKLVEMYRDTLATLMDDDPSVTEGNVTWTVSE